MRRLSLMLRDRQAQVRPKVPRNVYVLMINLSANRLTDRVSCIPIFEPPKIAHPKPEDHVYFGKVSYGDLAARARHAIPIDAVTDIIEIERVMGSISDAKVRQAFFRRMASAMHIELLWKCVTTKDAPWSHQNETRLLALNHLKKPHLPIRNAGVKPRVEMLQPLLRPNLAEVMVGPQADADAENRVRSFLDSLGLNAVPVTRSNVA